MLLDQILPLTHEQIDYYKVNKYIKIKDVFDAQTIQHFNTVISRKVEEMNHEKRDLLIRDT